MAIISFIYVLQITNCFAGFDSYPSYTNSLLYYDFSRGTSQRVPDSPFTQNAFNGEIRENAYLNIPDTHSIIGSTAQQSYSSYTVVFDVEFPDIIDEGAESAYFWGADSVQDVNTGAYNGNQYHFKLHNQKLGIENDVVIDAFPSSSTLNSNTRYLIAYVVSPTSAEAYIDGVSVGTQTLNNLESPAEYYIKVGGVGHADRPEQPLKLYQYAFYDGVLSQSDITELNEDLCRRQICDFGFICNTTNGLCVADCTEFEIDGYLLQCSTELDNTEEKIESNAESIESNTESIESNAESIGELQQQISDLMGKISALEQQIESDESGGEDNDVDNKEIISRFLRIFSQLV
eukprot:218815_1